MKSYKCLQPVDNGVRHEIGDTISLSDEHAKQPLTIGAIEEIKVAKKADPTAADIAADAKTKADAEAKAKADAEAKTKAKAAATAKK